MNDYRRCPYESGTRYQCTLQAGHEGQHVNDFQRDQQERRKQNPSIDDIRHVVREEIERAMRPALPQTESRSKEI